MKRRAFAFILIAALLLTQALLPGCAETPASEPDSESEPVSESEPEKTYPPCPVGTADELVEKYYPGAVRRYQMDLEGKDGRAEVLYDHTERHSPTRIREELLTAICLYDEDAGVWKADRVYGEVIGIFTEPTVAYTFRDFKISIPESWRETEWHIWSVGDVEIKWFLDDEEVMSFRFEQDFDDPEKTQSLHYENLGLMADLFTYQQEGMHIRVILNNPLFQVGS
ncbi:MAG: hypothetical protein J5849_00855, partial [Clostridia bacterium]|nr:hypothetical protein [Clostridia bacterium]